MALLFQMGIGDLGLSLELAAQPVEEELNPEPDFATTQLQPMEVQLALDQALKARHATPSCVL